MIGILLITLVVLLLINADATKGNAGERFVASLITLADMGFLTWLIA